VTNRKAEATTIAHKEKGLLNGSNTRKIVVIVEISLLIFGC
jgi:hypothetical protein